MTADPVCGMELKDDDIKASIEHEGTTHAFCSETCATRFAVNPDPYVGPGPEDVIDAVCGKGFKRSETPLHRVHRSRIYRFCSQECYHRFVLEPDRYAHPAEGA